MEKSCAFVGLARGRFKKR